MVIGNAGGGKTTLARQISKRLGLPLHHVDSIQFLPGWQRRPEQQCDQILNELTANKQWIIDGFGSDAVIVRRFKSADTVVFIDFPIWQHYVWAIKRQLLSRRTPRQELPENCPEFTLSYTLKLLRIMWQVHHDDTPWFRREIRTLSPSTTVFHIRSVREWRKFYSEMGDLQAM